MNHASYALEDQRLQVKKRLGTRVANRLRRMAKWASWQFTGPTQHLLFIVGCQRSGTELLLRIFDRDGRILVLGEQSCLTSDGQQHLRLKPWSEVNQTLRRIRAPIVVAKPLVESQRTVEMLQEVPGAKALWAFRHYADVAHSLVHRFPGKSMLDLQQLLSGDQQNWRAQNVTAETRTTVAAHCDDQTSPDEAAALLWFARNRLFFEQSLERHPNVRLMKYEDLVADPQTTIRSIYAFMGAASPRRDTAGEVDARSVGWGRNIVLRPAIEALCQALWARLDGEYQQQAESRASATDRPALGTGV